MSTIDVPGGIYRRFVAPQGIAASNRLDYWRTWYGELTGARVQLDLLDESAGDNFHPSAQMLYQGALRVAYVRQDTPCGVRGHRAIIDDADPIRLTLFMGESAFVNHGGERMRAHDGSLYLVRGSRAAGEWVAPDGLHAVEFSIDRDELDVTDAVLEGLASLGDLSRLPAASAVASPLLRGLALRMNDLASTPGDLTAVAKSVFHLLGGSVDESRLSADALAAARLVQAQDHIARNLASHRLDADDIAGALGVSRRTVYGLFTGEATGVATYIRTRRVEFAHSLILQHRQDMTLDEVAATSGFSSVQTMSRALRSRFGGSARSIRAGIAS